MYIGKSEDNQKDIRNVESVNRSIAYQNEAMIGKEHRDRDTFALSSGGRKQSMLQTLTKQRQDLADTRKAAEGTSAIELESKLEEYDEQIASLDESIAQLQIQPEETEESSGIYGRPQTEQEVQAQNPVDITEAGDVPQTLSRLRMQMIGCTNVPETQRETLYHIAPPVDPAMLHGPVTQLGSLIMQRLHRAPDTIKEMNSPT